MAEEQKLKITGEFDASKLNAAVNASAQNIKTKMADAANSMKSIGAEANNAASTGVRSLESAFERLNKQATLMRKNMHSAVIQLGGQALNQAGNALSQMDSEGAQMTGGALTGAAQGAAMGAMLGPLGAAIGGITGAAAGLITSFSNLKARADEIKYDKISKAQDDYLSVLRAQRKEKQIAEFSGLSSEGRSAKLEEMRDAVAKAREARDKAGKDLTYEITEENADAYNKAAAALKNLEERLAEFTNIDKKLTDQENKSIEEQKKKIEEITKARDAEQKKIDDEIRRKKLEDINTQISSTQSLANSILGAASNFKLTDDLTKIGGGTGYFNQMTGISDKVTQIISILKSQLDALKLMRDTTKNTTTFA